LIVAFLVINTDGVEKRYPVEHILTRVTNGDLLTLVAATGLSYNDMARGMQEAASMDADDIMRRADLLRALLAFIWFARQHAGEKLTYEESNEITWDEFEFESEDAEAEADPTPAVAEVVTAKATPRAARATSRRRSATA
jgi:hypothetical protein